MDECQLIITYVGVIQHLKFSNQDTSVRTWLKPVQPLERWDFSFSFRNLLPFSCVSLIFLLQGNALYFKSARNVTVNILNDQTKVLTQLITGKRRKLSGAGSMLSTQNQKLNEAPCELKKEMSANTL